MEDVFGSGRLEHCPFPTLAGRIFREGRSGELSLVSGARRRCVWFLGGNPVAVVSDSAQDHVAQFLLEHGRIGPETAARLALLPETREGVGAAALLPKEALNWGVKFRFVNLCYDLFRWDRGEYAFREGTPPKELFLLKVPAHSLIFKGIGHLEQSAVAEAVHDESVFLSGPVAAAEARYLGPEEQRLLDECRPGRTVAAVLAAAREDGEQTRKSIYAFLCLGLISLGRALTPPPALDAEGGEPEGAGEKLETVEPAPAPSPAPFRLTPGDASRSAGTTEPPTSYFTASPSPVRTPVPFTIRETASAAVLSRRELEKRTAFPAAGDVLPSGSETERGGPSSAPRSLWGRYASLPWRRLPRLAGVAIGAAAALVIVGAAWRWLSSEAEPPPKTYPPARREDRPPSAPQARPQPQPLTPPQSTKSTPQSIVASPPPAAEERYRRGLEAFRLGDVKGAAAAWEAILDEKWNSGFTIQLLTACQRQTIEELQRTVAPREIYLVGKRVNGRDCYRVCLGGYGTRESAAAELAGLPATFRAAGATVRNVPDVLTRDR